MLRALRRAAAGLCPDRRLFPSLARRRAGAAVGPGTVTAVLPAEGTPALRPGTVLRRPLSSPAPQTGGEWPELAEALADLRGRLDGEGRPPRLDLALQPPLARARAVRLPPAGRDELRRVLRREVARHFLDPPADPVVDAAPTGRDGREACVAVTAAAPLVSAVADAARTAGWTLGRVTAGEWALCEALVRLDRGARSGRTSVALERADDGGALVELDGGRFAGVRPPSPSAGSTPEPSTSFRLGPDGGGPDDLSAEALAALGAMLAPDDGPVVAPPEVRRAERRRVRLRAGLLAAAAAALIGLAAGLHLWGLDREISRLEAFRSDRGDRVARLTAAREASHVLGDLVNSIAQASARPGRWTELIAEVGERLPPSAHLESLSTTDEGLALTGRSRSPSALVPALERSPAVGEVRLAGVGGTQQAGMDGFRLELTLAEPPGPPPGADEDAPDPSTAAGVRGTGTAGADDRPRPPTGAGSGASDTPGDAPEAAGDPRSRAPGGAP